MNFYGSLRHPAFHVELDVTSASFFVDINFPTKPAHESFYHFQIQVVFAVLLLTDESKLSKNLVIDVIIAHSTMNYARSEINDLANLNGNDFSSNVKFGCIA